MYGLRTKSVIVIVSRMSLITEAFLASLCQVSWLKQKPRWLESGGNVLFYNALNSFYLWLYGKAALGKRVNQLPLLHGLLFLISSKGSFICTIQERIVYSTYFVTPAVKNWLEQKKNAQWVQTIDENGLTKRIWQIFVIKFRERLM